MSKWQKGLDVAERNQAGGMQTLDKLFAVTQPGAVYSQPVQAEGQTIITLNEVTVAMGYGFGVGEGSGPEPARARVSRRAEKGCTGEEWPGKTTPQG